MKEELKDVFHACYVRLLCTDAGCCSVFIIQLALLHFVIQFSPFPSWPSL